ncbi:TonB-dependent siderophore receptor [Pedobacter lithocola]|uniref:TonB-dependent siderophore receptor n=1 Tax=Pedobacter lithocola TaxID=1908239 RepID=A0ABV8PH64_9SPHI
MKFIFTILCLFVGIYCYGQGNLKGKITQNGGMPVSNINITLEKINKTTITDEKGDFSFNSIEAGTYSLKASGVNFVTSKATVKITTSKTTSVNLEITTLDTQLELVEISKKKDQTPSLTRTNTPLKDLPQSVQIVGTQQINDQQLLFIEDALKNVAGVNNSSPYGNFNYRGFETGLQEIMFNGMKGSPFAEGVSPMLSNVESIEVIHGPTAILYGQGALGGNINLITKQPKKFASVNTSLSAGNLNLYRGMADISGSFNNSKTLYAVASVGYQDGGAYLDRFKKRNLQLYGAVRYDLSLKTYIQLNGTYLNDVQTRNYTPSIPIVKTDLFALPIDFNYSGDDAYYKGSSYQAQLEVHHTFNPNWSSHLLTNLAESNSKRNEYGALGFYNPTTKELPRYFTKQYISSPSLSINPYLNGKISVAGIKNIFSFGVNTDFKRNNYPDGFMQYSANSIFLNNPDYGNFSTAGQTLFYLSDKETFTYNIFGAYLQNQFEITSKLKGLVGVRYNNYYSRYEVPSITYDGVSFDTYNEYPQVTSAFIPRFGLVYQPFKHSTFYVDYNEGFSPQYNNAKIYGGPFPPETSNNYELGYKGNFFENKLTAGIAAYRLNKSNVLTNALDPINTLLQRAIGQVRSQGIELSLGGNVTKAFFITANYANNSTKVRKSNRPAEIGQVFSNSPKHIANLWSSYQIHDGAMKGLQIGAGPRYISTRYLNVRKVDADVLKLPSYKVVDAMASYQVSNYKLQFNINNMFDKSYAQSGSYNVYVPGIPRNFLFTLAYSFKKQ